MVLREKYSSSHISFTLRAKHPHCHRSLPTILLPSWKLQKSSNRMVML
ncbi:unnamed protein product, partial [Callosobruchus maculatus]